MNYKGFKCKYTNCVDNKCFRGAADFVQYFE